jgi:hypothetical protein
MAATYRRDKTREIESCSVFQPAGVIGVNSSPHRDRSRPKRIVLEVASGEMTLPFRHGRPAARARHAPLFRGASVCAIGSGQARYFSLEEYHGLWRVLREADEVITWNGNRVALLVLRKLYGAEYFPIRQSQVGLAWGTHTDLCDVIESEGDLTHRISLAKAIELTFGEKVGLCRQAGRVPSEERVRRCNANAKQILGLWSAYHEGDGIALYGARTLFHPENRQAAA